MSGFEVAGLILAVYPLLVNTVYVYKAAKSSQAVDQLARKLKTEATIYKQFTTKLLACVSLQEVNQEAWQDENLQSQLMESLGSDRAELVLQDLHEMDELLKTLNTEISNMNRSSEVFGKLRSRLKASMASMSGFSIQNRLYRLKALNKNLRRLLDEPPGISLGAPPRESRRILSASCTFLHRDYKEPIEVYNVISQGYACNCDGPHLTNLGYHCPLCVAPFAPSKTTKHEWTFELIFTPQQHPASLADMEILARTSSKTQKVVCGIETADISSGDVRPPQSQNTAPSLMPDDGGKKRRRSLSVSLSHPSGKSDETPPIKDLCHAIENAVHNMPSKQSCLGVMGKSARKYKLCINARTETSTDDFVRITDLLHTGKPTLSKKQRMYLAFRISLAVLQLYVTPWINDSWTLQDMCVPKVFRAMHDDLDYDEEKVEYCNLFITQKFYSAQLAMARNQQRGCIEAIWVISAHEPTLTKLGCTLIELAFGRTLAEIRRERPNLFVKIDEESDRDLQNVYTARIILASGWISDEVSRRYEGVVKACLNHQYLDRSLRNKGLCSTDETFFDDVEEAIVTPLYEECRNHWEA